MANSNIKEILGDFVSLFFPNPCLACSDALVKGEAIICTRCMLEMPQTGYHNDMENPLLQRLSNRIPLQYAMALFKFSKSGRVQHLLHELKYKNHPEIGTILGCLYGEKIMESRVLRDINLIVPVPLHPLRRRKRGYNQSAKFAEGLSEKLGSPFSDDIMVRKLGTETQTLKTKLSRWENMVDVFSLQNKTSLADKKILLVDDVITTGSTLEACANVLLNAGCSELSIACIAVA